MIPPAAPTPMKKKAEKIHFSKFVLEAPDNPPKITRLEYFL